LVTLTFAFGVNNMMTEKERFRASVRRNYELVQTWPGWRRGAPAEAHELLHLETDIEQTEKGKNNNGHRY
jgi:hypothetical protein